MSTSANSIIWEKWNDPFLPMIKKGVLAKQFEAIEDEDDPDFHASRNSFLEDGETSIPNRYYQGQNSGTTGLVIYGPSGIVPLHESNIPSALYNFWMGHTNFHITRYVVNCVKRVPGVESIDVFSPYRFRIAVGRHFQHAAVMANISAAVCPNPKATNPVPVSDRLNKTFPFWAICTFTGGKQRCFGAKTKSGVQNQIDASLLKPISVATSWSKEK